MAEKLKFTKTTLRQGKRRDLSAEGEDDVHKSLKNRDLDEQVEDVLFEVDAEIDLGNLDQSGK